MEWKQLWENNYRGIGDTEDLEKYLKKLGYGSRTNISYLPWAVVERIFRLQGGDVDILRHSEETSVESDTAEVGVEYDDTTGVVKVKHMRSFFINIKAVWQGRTYIERYPLQDSNGKALTYWTQNDLNKSYQRGKVKAIAIISGIGYKLFEDGDLQFDEEKVVEDTPKVVKETKPKQTPKLVEIKQDPVGAEPVKETLIEETVQEIDNTESDNRTDIENDIKQAFITGGTVKAELIKNFLKEHSTVKVTDLPFEDLKVLHSLVK